MSIAKYLFVALVLLLLPLGACASTELDDDLLVVASDLDNPPFASVDGEGRPQGRDVEMTALLAERMGVRVEWRRMPFERLIDAVAEGEVDAAVATLGTTPERAERVLFTKPYYETEIVVVVSTRPGAPRRLSALEGGTLVGGVGTTSERAIRLVYGDDAFVPGTKDGASAAELVLDGSVDGAVMDAPNARALVEQVGPTLRILDEPLAMEHYSIAVRPNAPHLREELDRALAELDADKVLDRLDREFGLVVP
ncbi:MAG: ABC transporter substrate-binding protein [Planctomycetota bacterium]